MPTSKKNLGFVQIFWGDGKGKTTAALGTALRACGNGYNVHLVQFMKDGAPTLDEQVPGEIRALKNFPNFSFKRFGVGEWYVNQKDSKLFRENAEAALLHVAKSLKESSFDIIIADEILYAVQFKLLKKEMIVELIKNKPRSKELILTGSHRPIKEIFSKADLVTEMRKIKHPYDMGIIARQGIEF